MNDEIKEILQRLNKAMTDNNCIDKDIAKRYYDAITNLQQENEYNNYCEEELRKKISNLEYKITTLEDYKSRVEKAIEYIDRETGEGIYESGYGRGTAVTICKEHLLNILQNGSENNE